MEDISGDYLAVEAVSSLGRATSMAAYFVATGLNFEAFRQLLRTSPLKAAGKAAKKLPERSNHGWTIPDARAAVEALKVDSGKYTLKEALRHRPRLFWFLRINDADWLEHQIGRMRQHRMPTIEEDRVVIVHVTQSAKSIANRKTPLRARAEYIRAVIRDRAWFDQNTEVMTGRREISAVESRAILLSTRANMISSVIARSVNTLDRPARLNVFALSRSSGLSISQVEKVIAFHPGIHLEIDEANAGFLRRRLILAGDQLVARGHLLTAAYLCTTVGFYSNDPKALPIAVELQNSIFSSRPVETGPET